MIVYKNGDLLSAQETIIAHQVNCFGVAGGLAGHIFEKWPAAGKDYKQLCERLSGGACLGRATLTGEQEDGHIICNLFGQFFPGADTRYDALRRALSQLSDMMKAVGVEHAALPFRLGCGIGGGDWSVISHMIEDIFKEQTIVIYKK